jgi:hypothetical protein
VTSKPEEQTGGEAQGGEHDEEHDRPTVTPPFDPATFAQQETGTAPATPGKPAEETPTSSRRPGGRAPMPTITDPAELEAARLKSVGSGSTAPARPTPHGLLSLANARIPSNLPPRRTSTDAFNAVEREWDELATRPPPPLQQELVDATSRDAPPSSKQPDATRPVAPPTAREMNDRVALGDYTGALEVAEGLLSLEPEHEGARACAATCRGVLKQMYAARIGPLERVPVVMVARDQLRWLSIDHRAGFVLSLVDGVSSVEMILDVSGMPELDALRILSELAQQRILSFR